MKSFIVGSVPGKNSVYVNVGAVPRVYKNITKSTMARIREVCKNQVPLTAPGSIPMLIKYTK